MPVNTQHATYAAEAARWKRSRDAIAGQDAIHAAGESYLPRLKDQEKAEYDAYKTRALFYAAAGRTHEGLLGMLFRKAPIVTTPTAMRGWLDDIDLAGAPFNLLARDVCDEVLAVGRVGILVDFPRVAKPPANQAQAEAAGLRPMLALYKAEAIHNWQTARIGGVTKIARVVLFETVEVASDDEFAPKRVEQYRELALIEGVYWQRLWRKPDKGGDWAVFDEFTPIRNGATLDTIPFVFVGPRNMDPAIEAPPLLALIDVNLAHYRVTADYEHGCHFTGLPTPVVSGYQAENDEKLYIGSTTAWVFPNPDARASFLEFTGAGLTALKDNLAAKESMMAVLGARMLAPEKRQAEAAETAAIHRSGENSIMGDIAQTVSLALTRALQIAAEWGGLSGETKAEINREFLPVPMTAQELAALVKAWQDGAISYETLFTNLQRGDVIADDRTAEEERSAREDEGPAPAAGAALPLPGAQPGAQPQGGAAAAGR